VDEQRSSRGFSAETADATRRTFLASERTFVGVCFALYGIATIGHAALATGGVVLGLLTVVLILVY
jgi:hypothetical protein